MWYIVLIFATATKGESVNTEKCSEFLRRLEAHRKTIPNYIEPAKRGVGCSPISPTEPVRFCCAVFPPDRKGIRRNCDSPATVTADGVSLCENHKKMLGWKLCA